MATRAKRVADNEQAARALRCKRSPGLCRLSADRAHTLCGYAGVPDRTNVLTSVGVYSCGPHLFDGANQYNMLVFMLPLGLPRCGGARVVTNLNPVSEYRTDVLRGDDEPCIDVPDGLELVAVPIVRRLPVWRVDVDYYDRIDKEMCERLLTDTRVYLCADSVPTRNEMKTAKALVYAMALETDPVGHDADESIEYMPLDIVEQILRRV